MPRSLFRALTAHTLECTRCGSVDVHPSPGSMGPLIGLVGFMRYGCRGCRRPFWIRAGAGSGRSKASPAPDPTDETVAEKAPGAPPHPATPAVSLDFEIVPARSEKVDLTSLDAKFEKIRRGPSKPQKRTPRKADG